MQCTEKTKNGKPCPIPANRLRAKKPYCHVHDPAGTFRLQQRKKAVKQATR